MKSIAWCLSEILRHPSLHKHRYLNTYLTTDHSHVKLYWSPSHFGLLTDMFPPSFFIRIFLHYNPEAPYVPKMQYSLSNTAMFTHFQWINIVACPNTYSKASCHGDYVISWGLQVLLSARFVWFVYIVNVTNNTLLITVRTRKRVCFIPVRLFVAVGSGVARNFNLEGL